MIRFDLCRMLVIFLAPFEQQMRVSRDAETQVLFAKAKGEGFVFGHCSLHKTEKLQKEPHTRDAYEAFASVNNAHKLLFCLFVPIGMQLEQELVGYVE